MKNKKRITITDDFMFGKVMENPRIHRQVLEIILEQPISWEDPTSPVSALICSTQESMKEHSDSHGIRMDAYMESNTSMYNTEMQLAHKEELEFRCRYNSSMMDVNDLKPGQPYQSLRNSYVIFICGFDPMKLKEYKYEFITADMENNLHLNEGVTKIFVNLKGKQGHITPQLKELIDYMAGRLKAHECEQKLIKEIDVIVTDLNKDQEWRGELMKLEREMMMREVRGEVRGEARGESRGIYVLIDTLCSMGETFEDAMKKAAEQFGKSVSEIQEIMLAR